MNDLQSNMPDPIPDKFNDLRDLLADCHNLAAKIPSMITVSNGNALQVISSCIFIKILNTTKAVLMLIKNNLLSEVHVLLRHQMEAVFVLKACYEEEAFLQTYIDSDNLYRLKLGNVILNNQADFSINKKLDIEKIKETKEKLKSLVDENGIKEIKVEELSLRAKMGAHYNTGYRFFSDIVHVGIRSLDDYFVLDEKEEKIKELLIYPYQNRIATLYITSVELMLIAIECLDNIFKIDLKDKITIFQERLNKSAKSHVSSLTSETS